MKKKLFLVLITMAMCFNLVGCGTNDNSKNDKELKEAYNKISEYFGNEKTDRSNLGAYYIDEESNVVVVVLVENNKKNQEKFKELSKVDLKYIKFVQGGPYTTSSNN